jgi:predicted NBD/HSP70 family sugar kinase
MKNPNGFEIKKANRSRIYNRIRSEGSLSRQDLVSQLQLCLPTVTQNLNELQDEELLCESESFINTGGRRAHAYSLIQDARIAVGIDITRHRIVLVAVNLEGKILAQKRVFIDFSLEDTYFRNLGNLVDDLIEESGFDSKKILGVGIAVPGLITEDCQKVFYGEILNFTGVTNDRIGQYIPYPHALYNDANAAGFAEIWSDPEIKDAFYIMLGNNIGGSILINHCVYSGEGERSGEIGHITISPDGPFCYCGQRGCFETYCNATVLSNYTNGSLEMFFKKLKEGNPQFKTIWRQYVRYLSIAVNNICMLFNCKVILGGYVGVYLDDYIDEIKALCAERNPFERNGDYLQVCRYKTESIAAGAALPYIDRFIHNI